MSDMIKAGIGLAAGAMLLIAASPQPASLARSSSPAVDPSPAASGVSFTYRVTSSSSDKKVREQSNMLATVQVANGNVRIDYTEGLLPTGDKSGYVIISGEPARFLVVNPKKKQAVAMDPAALGGGMGAMANNPMVKMSVSDVSFRYKDMGAGEDILGYKTRRVRTWSTSTTSIKVTMLPEQKTTTTDSSDMWIATGMDVDLRDVERWGRSFAMSMKTSTPQVDAEMEKFFREYGASGMPLKTVTWSVQTDKNGKTKATDEITAEVTDLRIGAVDPSVFELPSDYEVMDMSKMMEGIKR